MLTHSRLFRKSIPLLLIPLTCQLCLTGWLLNLLIQAENESKRAARAHIVSESVSQLVRNLSDITRITDPEPGPLGADYFVLKMNVEHALANLKRAAEPAEQALVTELDRKTREALALLERARAGDGDQGELKNRYKLIKTQGMVLMTTKLIPLSVELKSLAQKDPELQNELRSNTKLLLLSFVFLNLAISVIFGVFLGREIVSRLRIMQDNCLRYASRLPLNSPVWGKDEIKELDSTFHAMAVEVDEMTRRERALVENARAMIFSLDSDLTFKDVNAACEKMLGYSIADLAGSRISELFSSDESDRVMEKLYSITAESGSKSCEEFEIETRMIKKDRTQTYVSFSSFWSPEQKTVFCIVNDINERKQAQQLKQELMQMVSHDLQTPLNTVRMFFEVMDLGVLGSMNEAGKSMISAAEMSLDKMAKLIGDVLEMEKIDSGALSIEKAETTIDDLFGNVEKLISGASQVKGVKVIFEPSELTFFADPDRMEQVLMNLVSNAIKFSPRDSIVTVSCTTSDGMIEISVADSGRGIPLDQQTSIFNRFKQVELADGRKRMGTGLGLAICKALIELHGGMITVESSPGKGSKFAVRIPMSAS